MLGWLGQATPLWAQKAQVQGWVTDEQSQPLMAATVVLLQPSDSVMVTFGITNAEGRFVMNEVPPGHYVFQLAFMGMQDVSQAVTVPMDQPTVDLGIFAMQERTQQLGEVTVTADHIPLLIRGDTIDYNARAYQTEQNAVVEDLLRQLPGVEVDADGNVRAQGEQVQRVLVDGKEFFGDDPLVATRNLPADAIERIKVYDKGSDASEFTGVDDGTRIKTIDLTLREDKKKGIFGKIGGGYGTEDVYTANANVNRFGGKSQLSLLGASNNRNLPAYSFSDYVNFQGGMNALSGGGGNMSFSANISDPSRQAGITTSHAGGLNFNHEFSDVLDLRSSYFYTAASNVLEGNTLRQSLLANQAVTTEESTQRSSSQSNHRGDARLRWEQPGKYSVLFSGNGSYGVNQGMQAQEATTTTAEGLRQNAQSLATESLGDNQQMNTGLSYQQLFDKPGRVFSLSGNLTYNAQQAGTSLYSESTFGDPGAGPVVSELVDQRQAERTDNLGYQAALGYTEPLGRGYYFESLYEFQNQAEALEKEFYDVQGPEEVLNTTLSGDFRKSYLTHRVGVGLRKNGNDLTYAVGVDFEQSQLGTQLGSGAVQTRSFQQWLPRINGEYNFTSSKSLRWSYQTQWQAPALQQLQPIINNTNPLVTVVGNPHLVPEYQHNLSVGYHSFSQLSFRSFFGNLSASYTGNKITYTQTIDDQFRQVLSPENTGAAWDANAFVGGSLLMKPIKTSLRVNGSWRVGQQPQWINGIENQTLRNTGQVSVSFDNKKKELLDWTLGARYGHTFVQYSALSALNQDYSNLTYYTRIGIPLGERWNVNTTFDYQQYLGESFGGTQTVPLWSGSVARTFGGNERLEVKLSVFDILNQNQGIVRQANLNFIEDQQFNALSRYFLLSATWSLNKFGNAPGMLKIERM